MMIEAGAVLAGQWLIQPSGAYLVDSVELSSGCAYLGTKRGVVVLPRDREVLVGQVEENQ